MLKEDDLNQLMRIYLEKQRYIILDYNLGTQKGPDIKACNEHGELIIECKGSCSAGGRFSKHATYTRLTSAVFNVINGVETFHQNNTKFALAFPSDGHYQELLAGMESFFLRMGVKIYWVWDDGRVEEQT